MKSYLELIPLTAKVRKRQNRMTILCIVIAVFLVTAMFSVADMMMQTQMDRVAGKDGSWQLEVTGITAQQAEELAAQPDVVRVGAGAVFNEDFDADYRLNGKRVVFYGGDVNFVNENRTTAFAGTYPQTENEVLLGKTAARVLHVSCGDTVTLTLPDGSEKTLTVTGIGGIDEDFHSQQYTALDSYFSQEGFAALLAACGVELPQTSYYIEYTSTAKAAKALPELRAQYGETAVSENLNVMGAAGQSSNTAFRTVYGMAAVLFVLVLLAGVLMISGSMNSSLAQRIQFFGMMRCIGMSKRQVVRFVRLEALNWCKTAVPLGLVLGTLSSWGVCGALRYGIGGEFATTPIFKLSPVGLGSGVVVGVSTVLLAAQAPARRAAKVSPMAAVSGGSQTVAAHHAAHTGKGRVETVLGIHHAVSSKKNWLLMTASFALSIVLALGFTVILQFVSLLLPSLVPWQPDVLYTGYSNELVLSRELTQQLRALPDVAQVWGCVGLVNTPASSDKGNIDHVTFCSYDETMMASSESVLVKGRMAAADNEVMTMYNRDNPMRIGDVITIHGVQLTIVGAFAQGVFSDDVTIVAPEALFDRVEGVQNYNMVGVQLDSTATDDTLFTLADFANDQILMQDLRKSNRQDLDTYYAARIVLVAFLAILGGISVLNIVNSISMSVTARTKQYGAMRAVGMDTVQLRRMVAAEAGTYAASGLVVGFAMGLVLHRALFTRLVTHYFGLTWQVPFGLLALLALLVWAAAALAVHGPVKRLTELPVTETISTL